MFADYDGGYKQALLDILHLVDNISDSRNGYGGFWACDIKSKKALANCLHTFLTLVLTDRDAYQEFITYHTTTRTDSPFVLDTKRGEVRFVTAQHDRYIKTKKITGNTEQLKMSSQAILDN